MRFNKSIGMTMLVMFSLLVLIVLGLPYTLNTVAQGFALEGRFQTGISMNWFYAHLFGTSVALLLGPLQFSNQILVKYRQAHRGLGRGYLFFGSMGSIAGLVMTRGIIAGLIGAAGFGLMAILWLITGVTALVMIRSRQVKRHKQWMIRNYALTWAALTLPLWLRVLMALGSVFLLDPIYVGDSEALFIDVYGLATWLAWIPNLLLAEWLFIRRSRPRKKVTTSAALSSVLS